MNKDRIAGAVKEIKGSIKETVGKAAGDAPRPYVNDACDTLSSAAGISLPPWVAHR
jgi:hypothetical protein